MNFRLPDLHHGQLEIFEATARNRVVVCGRRWGKTFLGCNEALRACLLGQQVYWIAPTHAVSALAWEQLKRIFAPLVAHGLAIVHESKKRINALRGSITCKSAEIYDNLRGAGLDLVIFDEADFIEQKAWTDAIRPTLSDRMGRALFLTTPNPRMRNSWIQRLYERGKRAGSKHWKSFSKPSWTNPYLPASEIEEARLDLPSIVFRTEYGAEFVSADGARIKEQWLQSTQAIPPSGLDVAIGVDLAISLSQTADYTAVVALGRSKDGRLYVLGASRGRMPFDEILRFVKSFSERYSPRVVGVENVQFQAAVVQELLRNTSLPVVGIRADRDKLTRFLPVAARYEQRLIYHAPNLPHDFTDELLSFPEVKHDDYVDALSTAYQALNFVAFSSVHASSGNKRGHLSGFIK